MANDIDLPGAGLKVATHEVSGKHYQLVKQVYGADGAAAVMDEKPSTEATLAALLAKFIASLPTELTSSLPVSQVPQRTARIGFDAVVASGVDTAAMTVINSGAGMGVSQTGGSLVITSGTTPYAETIIRSNASFSGALKSRYSYTISQRIANCESYIELVDVIGDGLAIVHNSATSVTVTIPSNPFTAANVGQGVYIGAISVASSLNQRAVIASVAGDNVTFTGAGFAATGTGTCSLFGWNYHHLYYNATTATNTKHGTQRNGWTAGDANVAINTTVAGHIGLFTTDAAKAGFFDQLSASSGTVELTQRASSVRNVPDENVTLRYQIRVVNLGSAPASSTTFTVGFIEVDQFVPQQVSIIGVEAQPINYAQGVQLVGTANNIATVSTVSTVTAVTTLSNGQTAHSAAATGSPVRVAGKVKTTNDTTLVSNDASDVAVTTDGAQIFKAFAAPELDWSYAAAAGGIVNTTDVAVKAAAGAGLRNYITSFTITNSSAVATEFVIKDGSTVIWRDYVGALTSMACKSGQMAQNPLKSTANTALNVACLTTSSAVYFNAQGYIAP